jgi:two-component system, NarL family, sensor histidine kinase UhpB
MLTLIDRTTDGVRSVSADLRPPFLEDLGLRAALEWLLQRVTRQTGIVHELHADAQHVPLEPARVAYLMFQEALTNVARHAGARRVVVTVTTSNADLLVTLTDDGKGIPREAILNPRSLGLIGMRERAAALGGSVTVEPGPGGGTVVRIRLPLEPGANRRSK